MSATLILISVTGREDSRQRRLIEGLYFSLGHVGARAMSFISAYERASFMLKACYRLCCLLMFTFLNELSWGRGWRH